MSANKTISVKQAVKVVKQHPQNSLVFRLNDDDFQIVRKDRPEKDGQIWNVVIPRRIASAHQIYQYLTLMDDLRTVL